MRAARSRTFRLARLAPIAASLLLVTAAPAGALEFPELEWEGSGTQKVTAKTIDLVIVRPIASVRVLVGSILFVPAALFSAPMGREGFEGALDVLITAPAEYAFDREVGAL